MFGASMAVTLFLGLFLAKHCNKIGKEIEVKTA